MLIYCLDANRDSDADDLAAGPSMVDARAPAVRSVRVRHAGKVLHTYALDLSGTTEDVARNLDELGDWIEDRAATTVGAPMSAVG